MKYIKEGGIAHAWRMFFRNDYDLDMIRLATYFDRLTERELFGE